VTHSDVIATDHPFSAGEQRMLRRVAGLMIPESRNDGVPGADDETIFADILAAARPIAPIVQDALARLGALADGRFVDSTDDAQRVLCDRFRALRSPQVNVLESLIVACYYRDDRVMTSLGMEPRAPFPRGYEVEAGDWSLLDPVRSRTKMYREVR